MTTHWLTVIVRDENHIGIPDILIRLSGVSSGYTGPNGGFDYEIVHGETREVQAVQQTGYTCVECVETVTVNEDTLVHLTMKTAVTPPTVANKQLIIGLKPLPWANRDLLRSYIPKILDVVTKNLANLSSKYNVIGNAELVGDDIIINIREER
ncbi:hypothetical protein KAW18_11685 [candidate division WOR-3 bacterium]|nr:hypothetical protein [candidate division WOR-3 bacterium]